MMFFVVLFLTLLPFAASAANEPTPALIEVEKKSVEILEEIEVLRDRVQIREMENPEEILGIARKGERFKKIGDESQWWIVEVEDKSGNVTTAKIARWEYLTKFYRTVKRPPPPSPTVPASPIPTLPRRQLAQVGETATRSFPDQPSKPTKVYQAPRIPTLIALIILPSLVLLYVVIRSQRS